MQERQRVHTRPDIRRTGRDPVILLPDRVETERLVLRHWGANDAPALDLAITRNLDHLRPWMPWIAHEPLSIEARTSMIEGWNQAWGEGGDSVLAVLLNDDVIGGLGLHRRVGRGGIEIGYWIDVDHVGQGLMTEAVAGAINALSEVPDIERVEIHHDKANTASAGVPRRLGFTMVEEAPKEIAAPGQVGIEWRWEVTMTDWRLGRSS